MMASSTSTYTLDTPLSRVAGVGQSLLTKFERHQIRQVKDLLLFIPLRYLDARQLNTIEQVKQIKQPKLVTVKGQVERVSQFRRGRKTIQTVFIVDDTNRLKLTFFNSSFVLMSLKKGQTYYFSGQYSPKYHSLTQPKFEPSGQEQLHTGRLVPYYSTKLNIVQGQLRRLIKHILDKLQPIPDFITQTQAHQTNPSSLNHIFTQLHFPQQPDDIEPARKRLALEEILGIIDYSETTKKYLKYQQKALTISTNQTHLNQTIKTLPFKLTPDQHQALNEILHDLNLSHPMNRLLMGDVGTGKTIVAGLAADQVVANQHHVALIAPTTILAHQQQKNLKHLLPQLPIQLVTARSKLNHRHLTQPSLFVGTHALINQLNVIKPALIIYDEQQKFGVWQRGAKLKDVQAHTLNMTATPIPRSLMLTIFSHVSLSNLKTHPHSKPPVKTWVVDETKRQQTFDWLRKKLTQQPTTAVLVVAPFIDPSYHRALENVKAVTDLLDEYRSQLPSIKTDLLHSRMTKTKQLKTINDFRQGETRVLIATPMIEVGLDLPMADIMMIESAERFGLASLHQLRGRVGRRGQQAYCLLLHHQTQSSVIDRLHQFSQLHDGASIAELDLHNRGGGGLFDTRQHGLTSLRFASWLDSNLIKQAQQIYQDLPKSWSSLLSPRVEVDVGQLN